MFLRWKRRHTATGALLSAVVAKCQRQGGRPRQTVVAYLGSIREDHANSLPSVRAAFWKAAGKRLDALALDPGMRQKLEMSIVLRVPQPTPAELQAQDRARADRWKQLGIQPL
jgi:hypothetical protein